MRSVGKRSLPGAHERSFDKRGCSLRMGYWIRTEEKSSSIDRPAQKRPKRARNVPCSEATRMCVEGGEKSVDARPTHSGNGIQKKNLR